MLNANLRLYLDNSKCFISIDRATLLLIQILNSYCAVRFSASSVNRFE